MKKITLLKDHESPEGNFRAGDTIEVNEETYDWLMSVYLSERIVQVEKEQKAEAQLRKHKVIT